MIRLRRRPRNVCLRCGWSDAYPHPRQYYDPLREATNEPSTALLTCYRPQYPKSTWSRFRDRALDLLGRIG